MKTVLTYGEIQRLTVLLCLVMAAKLWLDNGCLKVGLIKLSIEKWLIEYRIQLQNNTYTHTLMITDPWMMKTFVLCRLFPEKCTKFTGFIFHPWPPSISSFSQLENLLPLPSINRWPDVLTCLLATQTLSGQTDFTQLDWTVGRPWQTLYRLVFCDFKISQRITCTFVGWGNYPSS